jgi:hypothetical protein
VERNAILARFTLHITESGFPVVTTEYVDTKKLQALLDDLSYEGAEALVEAAEYTKQRLLEITHDLVKRYDTTYEEETLH